MRKIIIYITFCLLCTSSYSFAQTVAVTLKVRGDAKLTKGAQASAQQIRRGSRLVDKDKLTTGKNGFAALRFIDDKSTVRIRSNSTCQINAKKENKTILKNIFLEAGAIYARVTQQRDRFQVATPTSVASVKGTDWITEHTSEKGSLYHCKIGVIEVSNEAGTARATSDETVEVANDQTPPRTRKTRPGEGDWDDGLEGGDDYEFEFENEAGERQTLRFRVQREQ
jgi:hypothetical protein